MAESESEIKKGDIVRIKSGGPAMTALNSPLNGLLYCAWWNPKRQDLARESFPIDAIEKTSEPDIFPPIAS